MKFPKSIFAMIFMALLLTGCTVEDNKDFWSAETCNERIEADVVDFEEYQVNFGKSKKQMETDARSGNTTSAEANKKNAESWKTSTDSLLRFIDSNIMPVCEGKIRAELLEKVEAARKFAKDGATIEAVEAEGMPDLRVTSVTSTFVPYEMDEYNRCIGPYLNLVFTVTNQGDDYPRPVDLETYTTRAQRKAEELTFFTAIGELDFGGDMKKRFDLEVKGDTGMLKSGATLNIPVKYKVENNQVHAKVKGTIQATAFLKAAENTVPYENEIDIPIWDIYTESHSVIDGIDPDTKKYYIGSKAIVTNRGKTPTPGPIEGSFMVNEIDPHRRIISWSGKTKGSVSANTEIYARTDSDLKMPTDFTVDTSIIPLCPDGTSGNLADGDTKNNTRTLQQR